MDDHSDEGREAFGWSAALNRAQSSARDIPSIVATVCRELNNRGQGQMEMSFLAAAWTWTVGIKH